MAQLSDDCFAFGGDLLGVDAALELIRARIAPAGGRETVDIADADGRFLAQTLIAPVDLPGFDNSAVDGYAVRFADLAAAGETALEIAARIAAGDPRVVRAREKTVARIFTGAPMPEDADTVFMQEDVRAEGAHVVLPPGLKKGANRRLRGEDIVKGAVALEAGRRLTPRDIALAAALGVARLDVARRLRVAVFSTGDEIAAPGNLLPPGGAYDANRFLLGAMARRLGAQVTDLGILSDSAEATAAALRDAAGAHDLVLTSGGVSTGEADHVRAAIEAGGRLVFWRLAIKPGRPVAMGVVRGTPLIGLPGNPVAAFITFAYVVRPLIAALSGADLPAPRATPVISGFRYSKKAGRREYVRVHLSRRDDGAMVARKYEMDGAGVITSLTRTDGLVELPEDVKKVEPGDAVGFIDYALLM